MRELTKTLGRFSWAAAIFGVRQMGNLVDPRTWVQPDSPSRRELGEVAEAVVNQLGSAGRQAFDAGDRLQGSAVDAVFFLAWPLGLLSNDSRRASSAGPTAGPPASEARAAAPSPFDGNSGAGRGAQGQGGGQGVNRESANGLGVEVGVPSVFYKRRGVTGISTGGVVAQGDLRTDEAGNIHISKQIVAGPVYLNHDGLKTEGTETFEINGSLDRNFSGTVYGAFTLSMKEGGSETIIWDGHWAGTIARKIGKSIMVARGRGPFTGKALYLHMKEIEPTDEYPDPNVYVLDGYMAEEEQHAAVQSGVAA